jgi:tetratricopeptide (TPR) repeat protein
MAAYVLYRLGRVLQGHGDLGAAWKNESKAVSTFAEIGQIHTDANVALANVLLDLGKAEEAAAEVHRALRILDTAKVVNDQPLAESALARILLAQHRVAEAGGSDTVDVGMKLKFLVPGMEHAEEADLGSQMGAVARHFE